MREIVNFRDRQEVQAADFTNLQLYARASFDDLIRDAISNGKGFAGFEVTQATSSDVSVAAGRFYTAGAMYYRDTATTVQLASMLPLVTKKKVAIVVWGVPAEMDTEPRDFLVDVETGETEPQVVAMHNARQVQMQAIAGIEAPIGSPASRKTPRFWRSCVEGHGRSAHRDHCLGDRRDQTAAHHRRRSARRPANGR